MRRKRKLKVTPSGGNVFRDLGFSTEEAEHLLIRADLLIQLHKAIAARGMTRAKAATILRVTQPRVSESVSRWWRGTESNCRHYDFQSKKRRQLGAAEHRCPGCCRGFRIPEATPTHPQPLPILSHLSAEFFTP